GEEGPHLDEAALVKPARVQEPPHARQQGHEIQEAEHGQHGPGAPHASPAPFRAALAPAISSSSIRSRRACSYFQASYSRSRSSSAALRAAVAAISSRRAISSRACTPASRSAARWVRSMAPSEAWACTL